MISLDPATTALVLIDLQNGIVAGTTAPRSGAETLAAGQALARRCRAAGVAVVLVNVGWADDFADAPRQPVDQPRVFPAEGLPAGWSDLAPGLAQPGDLRVTKRQWGAFYGTELDLQLRRRGIATVLLGGLVTNLGVESTARQAWERGYATVIVEDACAAPTAEMHDFAVRWIFPRIARVAAASDLAFAPRP